MNTSEGCKWDLRFRDLWGQREPVQLRDWLPQKYKDVKIGEDMKYKSNAELQAESSYKLCMTCNVGVYQGDSTNYNEDGSHHVCVKTIYTVPPHVGVNVEVPSGSVVSFYDPKSRGYKTT